MKNPGQQARGNQLRISPAKTEAGKVFIPQLLETASWGQWERHSLWAQPEEAQPQCSKAQVLLVATQACPAQPLLQQCPPTYPLHQGSEPTPQKQQFEHGFEHQSPLDY